MKKLKKIVKWFLISLLTLVIVILIFRNELFVYVLKMDFSSKMKRPVTMLELPVIDDSTYQVLADDFNKNHHTAHEYVVEEFKTHDIIFLGEYHRVKRDAVFVKELIPYLYETGVRNIGYEFLLDEQNQQIKEIITNSSFFDEEKAEKIFFDFSPYMVYEEQYNILKSIWEFNKNLPEEAEKFILLGIMSPVDFSVIKTAKDMENIEHGVLDETTMRFHKGVIDGEKFMADCIIENFVRKNKKALIYCGMHHAFTGYRGHGNRTGVIIKDEIGEKVMTISLHSPWRSKKGSKYDWIYPVNGYLDAFIRKHKSEKFAFGINVKNTAFGNLTDTTSDYIYKDDFKLKDFCDGYIYLNSLSSIEGVTAKHVINWSNFDQAKDQFPNPELKSGIMRFLGPKAFNAISSVDPQSVKYRVRHLY